MWVVLDHDVCRLCGCLTGGRRDGREDVLRVVAQGGTGTLVARQIGRHVGSGNLRVLVGHGHLAARRRGVEAVVASGDVAPSATTRQGRIHAFGGKVVLDQRLAVFIDGHASAVAGTVVVVVDEVYVAVARLWQTAHAALAPEVAGKGEVECHLAVSPAAAAGVGVGVAARGVVEVVVGVGRPVATLAVEGAVLRVDQRAVVYPYVAALVGDQV